MLYAVGRMSGRSRENPVTLLMREGHTQAEVYLWFAGNPFALHDTRLVTADFTEDWEPDSRLQGAGLELVTHMGSLERTIGYVAAGKSFMLFGSAARDWNRNLMEVVRFFPTDHTVVSRLDDKHPRIAEEASLRRRIQMVRGAAVPHSTRLLPLVELHVPTNRRKDDDSASESYQAAQSV